MFWRSERISITIYKETLREKKDENNSDQVALRVTLQVTRIILVIDEWWQIQLDNWIAIPALPE